MKNLKTLKDIEYVAEEEYGYAVDVDANVLRDAAREWIKERYIVFLEKYKCPSGEYDLFTIDEVKEILDDWVNMFFNLEDEDKPQTIHVFGGISLIPDKPTKEEIEYFKKHPINLEDENEK